jgi:hypothetical protein
MISIIGTLKLQDDGAIWFRCEDGNFRVAWHGQVADVHRALTEIFESHARNSIFKIKLQAPKPSVVSRGVAKLTPFRTGSGVPVIGPKETPTEAEGGSVKAPSPKNSYWPKCFVCSEGIVGCYRMKLNKKNGTIRPVHAGVCEDSLDQKQYETFSNIDESMKCSVCKRDLACLPFWTDQLPNKKLVFYCPSCNAKKELLKGKEKSSRRKTRAEKPARKKTRKAKKKAKKPKGG